MASDEVYARVLELLQRQGWASYRTLHRRFGLDEAALAALTQHLLATQPVTVDDTGSRLVWQGELRPAPGPTRTWDAAPTVVPASPPVVPSVAGAAPQPLGSERRRGLTPLVGRAQEIELLLARWAQVQAGQGQVVGLRGEAGIGKSHLVQVVRASVAEFPHSCWMCRGVATAQYSAFYPVLDLLQQVLEYHPEDSPASKLQKLETLLASSPGTLPEAVPLLAALLAVPLDDRSLPLTLTPERQRQRTLETLLTVVRGLTVRQPVLLIMEDLHWVDPSTLEFLGLLVAQAATMRLYVLLTWRPEFQPPWPPPAHQTTLTLGRLLPAQVAQLATQVAGGKVLPPAVLEQVVAKTEGVPLFVEELTQMVLGSGLVQEAGDHYALTGPLPPLAIPPTVQDSLVARLAQLGAAQAVAQVGAVWGRGFTEAQLQAVAPLDRRRLDQALARLVEADILREVLLPPRMAYVFKHALLQEAAYASLPMDQRQQVHGQVAQVLEERFPETVATQPELLAHHYTKAGVREQAIAYWQRAGQQALHRSANLEAIQHLTTALELLATLPDTPARAQQELDLRIALGPALMAMKGLAAPEVAQVYARARELCQYMGETPQLFPVLWGLWMFYYSRGQFHLAWEMGTPILDLAQRQHEPALLLEAHLVLGSTLYCLGELVRARAHLEQSRALYDPQQHGAHALLYGGHDPGVCCRGSEAWILWLQGYPDQALERMHEGLALAHRLSHSLSLTHARLKAAWLHQFRREGHAAQAQAEAALTLATEQGFPYWLAAGTATRGGALAVQGQVAEGIAQLRQGLDAWQAMGADGFRPYFLALLAEAYGKVGQGEGGLAVLVEALTAAQNTGERFYEAELYRLKGELLLRQATGRGEGQTDPAQPAMLAGAEPCVMPAAEACFRQALAIARRQQAKSLELRAAMSLSRLWQHQGKSPEARALLAPIYGWFTEGFATADLLEARTLLEELAGCA
jgi:predicted ATPase